MRTTIEQHAPDVGHIGQAHLASAFTRAIWCVVVVTTGCMAGARTIPDVVRDPTVTDHSVIPGTSAAVSAFVDVAVVPMDRERVLAHQTVVIQSGRIAILGSAGQVKIPAGAVRIDGRGKYLIPGLADMHAHVPSIRMVMMNKAETPEGTAMAERMLFLMLANGVTTARLMYAWPATLRLKERAASGELLSPRIYAGKVANPPGRKDTAAFAADKAAGYDFVKISTESRVSALPFDAFVMAARRAGLPVAGHITPTQAMRAGVASIEHLQGFSELLAGVEGWGRGRETWDLMAKHPIDTTKLRTLASEMRQSGVWNCPTQMLYEINIVSVDTLEHWPEMVYVTDEARSDWREMWNIPVVPTALSAAQPSMIARRKVIKALQDAGAGLLLGTDTPVPYMVPGFAVHRELEVLVHSGLTPYEALVTGTRNPAAFFGTLDSTGTITVGKRADVVLLNGNPLTDIRHTAKPAGVMVNGHWIGRVELDNRLEALKGKVF